MDKSTINQFSANKHLSGKLENVKESFNKYAADKERVRRKVCLTPGNFTHLADQEINSRLPRGQKWYRADESTWTHNCIIVILTNGSQVNIKRYV